MCRFPPPVVDWPCALLPTHRLGDHGVLALADSVSKLLLGLTELRLANVGMSAKSATALGKAIAENKRNHAALQVLDVSDNQIATVRTSAAGREARPAKWRHCAECTS